MSPRLIAVVDLLASVGKERTCGPLVKGSPLYDAVSAYCREDLPERCEDDAPADWVPLYFGERWSPGLWDRMASDARKAWLFLIRMCDPRQPLLAFDGERVEEAESAAIVRAAEVFRRAIAPHLPSHVTDSEPPIGRSVKIRPSTPGLQIVLPTEARSFEFNAENFVKWSTAAETIVRSIASAKHISWSNINAEAREIVACQLGNIAQWHESHSAVIDCRSEVVRLRTKAGFKDECIAAAGISSPTAIGLAQCLASLLIRVASRAEFFGSRVYELQAGDFDETDWRKARSLLAAFPSFDAAAVSADLQRERAAVEYLLAKEGDVTDVVTKKECRVIFDRSWPWIETHKMGEGVVRLVGGKNGRQVEVNLSGLTPSERATYEILRRKRLEKAEIALDRKTRKKSKTSRHHQISS